jgi:hypothetical protein
MAGGRRRAGGGFQECGRTHLLPVGTKVYGIHGGKVTPEGHLDRPEAWHASNALLSAARAAVRDMPDVRTHFKPIATGEVVLADADSDIARHVRERYNDAAAFEMEGSGAAHAAHLEVRDALVIRGVSDHANAEKAVADAGGSQQRAAAQAAAVAVGLLRKYRAWDGSSDDSEESRQGGYEGDHIDVRGGTFYGPVIGKQVGGR